MPTQSQSAPEPTRYLDQAEMLDRMSSRQADALRAMQAKQRARMETAQGRTVAHRPALLPACPS